MSSVASAKLRPLGEMLVARKIVDEGDLDALREAARAAGVRIASQCLEWALADERQLAAVLAEQQGHPCVVLSESVLPLGGLALVPRVVAEQHRLLPVSVDESELLLACDDVEPRDIFAHVAFAAGREVRPVLALKRPLEETIGRAYDALQRRERTLAGAAVDAERAATPSLVLERPPQPLPVDDDSIVDVLLLEDEVSGPTSAASAGRPLVLIVDDEDDLRSLLRRLMEHDGYRVREAANGRDAMTALREERPAAVLLDAMLPEIHGFEICRAIKHSDALRHIPVVMVSAVYKGWQNAREIQEVHQADAFVEKPFDVHYLRQLVARLLGGAAKRPELDEPVTRELVRQRNVATVSYRMGDLDDAVAAIERWRDLDPFDANAYLMLGNVLTKRGEADGAMRAYERAAAFGPDVFAAFKNLALTYEQLGFTTRAFATWSRAYELAGEAGMRAQIEERLRARYRSFM